jgi:hypothetical protein
MRFELWKRVTLGRVILSVMLRLLGLLFLSVPWDLLRALGKQTSCQILVSDLFSKAFRLEEELNFSSQEPISTR